jgi:hypothetical protein
MAAIFRAVLPGGAEVTGPIQGAGGLLGDGATHLVGVARKRAAVEALRRAIAHQPELIMYPSCSAAGNGKPVAVPIEGTRFYLVQP